MLKLYKEAAVVFLICVLSVSFMPLTDSCFFSAYASSGSDNTLEQAGPADLDEVGIIDGSKEPAFQYVQGSYKGSKTATFDINPKGTTVSKLKKAKKAFTVKWKKQSAKMSETTITGYQVRYALNSSMSDTKTVTVKGYKKTSKKIKKLKAKKTYYVQVRTFKTVNSKKYYSDWSPVKTVKTK